MIFVIYSNNSISTIILILNIRFEAINWYKSILKDEDQFYLKHFLSNTLQCKKMHVQENTWPRMCIPKKKGKSLVYKGVACNTALALWDAQCDWVRYLASEVT